MRKTTTTIKKTNTRCTFENLENRQLMSAASLDPTFGTGGKITANLYAQDNVHGMYTQADGKTLLVEDTGDKGWLVSRRLTNGQYDLGFGTNGVRRIDFGDTPRAAGIAVQPNGKIIVVGSADTGLSDYVVSARLTSNGNLDKSYAKPDYGQGTGIAYTEIDSQTFYGMVKGEAHAVGVNIRGDGSILIGGTSNVKLQSAHLDDNQFFVVKLNADGKVVNSFGGHNNGVASYDIDGNTINAGGDIAHAMTVDSLGRILIAGTSDGKMALFRFAADGQRDWNFGSAGAVRYNFANAVFNDAYALAIAPNGKIVIGGDAFIKNVGHEWGLMRFNANGTLDNTFNYTGMKAVTVNTGWGMVKSLAYGIDGKLIAAGTGDLNNTSSDFSLIRFTDAGKMDTGFGFGGFASTDFKSGGFDEVSQMNITPTGKVLLAGTSQAKNGQDYVALARFEGHAPTFSILAVSTGKEGTGKLPTFKITRDGNPWDGSYDVNLAYSGPAIQGVDYTPIKKVHFNAGQSSVYVSLPLLNHKLNSFYEGIVVTIKPDVTYDVNWSTTTIGIYDL